MSPMPVRHARRTCKNVGIADKSNVVTSLSLVGFLAFVRWGQAAGVMLLRGSNDGRNV